MYSVLILHANTVYRKVITLHIWLHENKKIHIHEHSNCTHPRQIKKKMKDVWYLKINMIKEGKRIHSVQHKVFVQYERGA